MTARVLNGDAIEILRQLPEKYVDTCVTSPPYYGLRDYGTSGQIGLEQTPEEYIARLVDVFKEVRRVLKDDGTIWVNIGDSYAHDSKWGGASGGKHAKALHGNTGIGRNKINTGLKDKDLVGIPWMLAFALRADGWYLRQDIIWQKPNCMPESVKDRCTKSHEYIFLLSKSKHYFFNAEAISEPIAGSSTKRYLQNIELQRGSSRAIGKTNGNMKSVLPRFGEKKYGSNAKEENRTKSGKEYTPTLRRNKRDVWSIATTGFKGAHFAVFPEKLVQPCILAGSRRGGIVLDPFCGSGTTGKVALDEGRGFIGIELNPEYCEISRQRIGISTETPPVSWTVMANRPPGACIGGRLPFSGKYYYYVWFEEPPTEGEAHE